MEGRRSNQAVIDSQTHSPLSRDPGISLLGTGLIQLMKGLKQPVSLRIVVIPAAIRHRGYLQKGNVLLKAESPTIPPLIHILEVILLGCVQDHHIGNRGIVLILHPRRGSLLTLLHLMDHGRVHLHLSQDVLQLS